MKIFWLFLTIIFIILTLGIIDVEMSFNDGSSIRYRGWPHLFYKGE